MFHIFRFALVLILLSVIVLPVPSVLAQPTASSPLTAEQRAAIVDSAVRILADQYAFPDIGKRMADHLHKRDKQGAYRDFTLLPEFARCLTEDMRSISKDQHLEVMVAQPEAQGGEPVDTAAEHVRELAEARRNNFGFVKVEHLAGNIGYLKFNQFYLANTAGPTAIAAMNFLGNCDALIFDLRDNGGGAPSMIQLITSYLYEEPQFLDMFEVRGEERPYQFWSYAYVPGPRLLNVPVYVLTSERTFSAAEGFAYDLKNLKRATIVGQTTRGGAHPVSFIPVRSLGVVFKVPYGRAVNPISGTNWEGTGVKPDIETPESEALDVAYLEALKTLCGKDSALEHKAVLTWYIAGLEAKRHPLQLSIDELRAFTGTYGPRVVSLESDALYYQRDSNPKRRLIPMAKNLFALDGVDYFRVEFVSGPSGDASELVGHYEDGTTDRHSRK